MKFKFLMIAMALITISIQAFGDVNCYNPATGAQLEIANARGGVSVLGMNDVLIDSLKLQTHLSLIHSDMTGNLNHGNNGVYFTTGTTGYGYSIEVKGSEQGLTLKLYSTNTQNKMMANFYFNSGECHIQYY